MIKITFSFLGLLIAVFFAGLVLRSPAPLPETALAQTADPVLVGAGDIANCNRTQDGSTAQLLDGIAGTVVTLGDNTYPDGTPTQFTNCYGPTWGRHKNRTRPTPGNHDYHTAGAAGYYTYFGAAASPRDTNCTSNCQGYYSYTLGDWHIIALNSELAHGAGSAQEQWLRADLAANQSMCTLAYWHRPRFSSGQHGNNSSVQPLWRALYEYGADVVLNGHDHTYERFAPQNPGGQADPTRGIREFVVGTGGAGLYPFPAVQANSQVRNNTTWGVLKLTLHPTSYDWEFIPVAGQTFTDAGSANCVSAGPGPTLPFKIYLPAIWRGRSQPPAATGSLDSNWTKKTVKPSLFKSVAYHAVPIANPQPPSTLLPPGTTALSLTVESTENTICAFGMGAAVPYAEMTPFDQGAGTTVHQTTLSNLDPDPNVVNNIYVRCASHPDYLLKLKYRSLSQANPSYPRTGNLWGWWDLFGKGLPYMAHIDLWLGAAHATADQIRELRLLNPNMRILTNINAVNGANLPDDYYLKDIHGNRFEVWPNSYRLNLTKPYVAEYQARYAYQQVLDKDLMFDGVFFDNVFTTQSWRKYDIHGNRFLVDADENGVEDDPDALDAAWRAGVFHEMETFRTLMPHAIMSGHGMDIYEPGIAEIFNGISIVRRTADVLEGEMSFADLWNEYHAWHEMARQPRVTMVESSPPDQIAYGYDYSPWDKIPPSTLEFARTYYPYVRFGLALTLMNDGYFAHEFGDTWHGNDWWYDELNFELGYPLGPAERVDLGVPPGEDQNVYQRKFTNGLVLLNGSQESQEITIGPGYRRLHGQQAPRYETILDDAEAAFSTTGTWTSVKYDSGELQATGPFYHCWRETCHERSGSQGKARWDLEIQAADTYTITAWWPAAPQADTWNQNVTYEVVVGEQVVASQTFDQRSGGDEWHFVAEVPLSPNNMNYVRMQCQGGAPCLADALHIRSQARYNDGSSATKVTLQPLDGVILTRLKGSAVYLPLLLKK